MSLLTKPTALTSASRVLFSLINTLYTDLYDKIGHTVSGRGTLTWENLSASAAIVNTQILNTAAVLGGGTTQAMANAFKQTAPYYDVSAGNTGTMTNAAAAALAAGKLWQRTGGTTTITTITGGTEGQVIVVIKEHAVTLTHSATDTLNSLHMKSLAVGSAGASHTATGTTADSMSFKFIYTTNGGAWTNLQWLEI